MSDPVTTMVVVGAVSYLANYLLRTKTSSSLDDSYTEPAVRGTLNPLLMGRMRISPVVGYVGSRKVTKEKSGSSGGKGGGGSKTKTTIYNEVGMHIFSIGQGVKLRGIYQSGTNLLADNGIVSASTTSSGSTIDLGKEGSFKIYWGTDTQPIDTTLAALTGLYSTFPYTFYIVWNRKRLGTSATWPALEYDVEVTHPESMSIPTGGGYLRGTVDETEYSGVNVASALYQMLFESNPHGLGIDTKYFNMDDFTDLADFFANTEMSPCTVYLSGGKSFQDGLGMILQDFGIQFYYDKSIGKFRVHQARVVAESKTLTTAEYASSEAESELAYAVLQADRTVYSFADSARKFTDSTIMVTNDGNAKYSENPNTSKVSLDTITDLVTASMVASRREQEDSLDGTLALDVSYARTDLSIGDQFSIDGFNGLYRVIEREQTPDESTMHITFMIDAYSIDNNYEAQIATPSAPTHLPVEDAAFSLFPVNRFMSPDQDGFIVNRIRAAGYIISSEIYTSPSGDSYTLLEEVFYCTGGTLQEDLGITGTLIERGAAITTLGPDITDVADLTASDAQWRGGQQIAIIGTSEVCFISGIDIATGELLGVIRARYGTRMAEHAAGTPVFIVQSDALTDYSVSFLTAGVSVYAKSLPYSSDGQVAADDVSAVSLTYAGGGYRPLPCENLVTVSGTPAWVAGEDISLRWDYKNAADNGAAGIGLSDEPSIQADAEGTFRLRFYAGTVLKRTQELTQTSYIYTNADIVSDFGSEPSTMTITVEEVLNGLTSEPETLTVTKI